MRTLKLTLVLLTLMGCAEQVDAPAPDPTQEFEETTQPLLGEVIDVDNACGAAAMANINDAVDWLIGRVLSYEYQACIADAFGVESEGRAIEELIANSMTLRDVYFTCTDNGCKKSCNGDVCTYSPACASHDTINETLTVARSFATNASVEDLGSVILHEIMHNHAWYHMHFYGPTWPDHAQVCARDEEAWGVNRRDMGGEVALAPVGGDGGVMLEQRCDDHEAMVGLRGAVNDSAIARLSPICRKIDGDEIVDGYEFFPMSVPSGSTHFWDFCPTGQVVTRILGNADHIVRRTMLVCSDLSALRAPEDITIPSTTRSARGHTQGHFFDRDCLNRKAGVGLRMRHGALLDRFELICDDAPVGPRDVEGHTWGVGGWGGQPFDLDCEGHSVLTGLYGQWDPQIGAHRTIGGQCRPLTHGSLSRDRTWGGALNYTEYAGGMLNNSQLNDVRNCGDGELLVGLATHANHMVVHTSPICANWSTWREGNPSTRVVSPKTIAGLSPQTELCSPGQVATAIKGRAGARIDRLQLVCEEPDPSGSLTRVADEGGSGGQPFEEVCPQGRPVTGIWTLEDGTRLKALTAQCGRHTDLGTSTFGGVRLSSLKGHEDNRMDSCPLGQVAVGLEVAEDNGLVDRVRVLCLPEADAILGSTRVTPFTGPWRGDASNTATKPLRCKNGEVMRGLYGRQGALMDAVGIVCGKPTLRDGQTGYGVIHGADEVVWPVFIPREYSGPFQITMTGGYGMRDSELLLRPAHHPNHDNALFRSFSPGYATTINATGTLTPGLWFVSFRGRSISRGGSHYQLNVNLGEATRSTLLR